MAKVIRFWSESRIWFELILCLDSQAVYFPTKSGIPSPKVNVRIQLE